MVPLKRGMTVLEIGGGLSGFQFVAAKTGVHFTNVDPFLDYGADDKYSFDVKKIFYRLNRSFRTEVCLKKACLWEVEIDGESIDVVYAISVMEHLPPEALERTLKILHKVLKPGGFFVATLDLFLNVRPFCKRDENQWGTNVSVRDLVEKARLKLIYGNPAELYGFPDFNVETVLSHLENYLVNNCYPQLVQLFVLQK